MSKYKLRLYVTGHTRHSERAIANLRRICMDELNGEYEMEVIDVLEHPKLAEQDRILATPTLIRSLPPPMRRLIGDLSDREQILLGLDLMDRESENNTKLK